MSINCFRSFLNVVDQGELMALHDDLIALMVLRHHGVPTRLLDWSISPWVAAYFATFGCDEEEGELWAFDEALYEIEGAKQWEKWPATRSETSKDPNKFSPHSAFLDKEPDDWFVCHFYDQGFPRQKAQMGAYSMTAQFGRDHANSIQELLMRNDSFHVYIFDPALKPRIQKFLREYFKIWRGTLFPDSAGAAETTRQLVYPVKI